MNSIQKIRRGMRGHKQDYFVLGLALVLIIIVIAAAYIASTSSNSQSTPPDTIQPTLLPARAPTPSTTEKKYITYDDEASDRLLERVNNRPVLSDNDKLAKAKILALFPAGVQSGVLYQSNTIIIDYTHVIDLFMVEILTNDIQKAKAEANVWFVTRGMSQKGLCDLPLMFYVNTEVVQKLQKVDIEFSPVASTC